MGFIVDDGFIMLWEVSHNVKHVKWRPVFLTTCIYVLFYLQPGAGNLKLEDDLKPAGEANHPPSQYVGLSSNSTLRDS